MLLLHTTNRLPHGLSIRVIPYDLEGQLASCKAFQMQFHKHLCNISHSFNWHSASCDPSETAELVVITLTTICLIKTTGVQVSTKYSAWSEDIKILKAELET